MNAADQKQRIEAAFKILHAQSSSVEKLESIFTLLQGINPKIDKIIDSCAKSLSTLGKLQKGEIIELAAENLPTETKEQERRKKTILFLIKNLKDLEGELERAKEELDKSNGSQARLNIATFAKGPFGLVTALAIVIVLALAFINSNRSGSQTQTASTTPSETPIATSSPSPASTPISSPKSTIKVITFGGKKIPLSELEVKTGPDCTSSPQEAPHYHAKNGHSVRATDGTTIPDPGACAYGKVEGTNIEEIQTP